MFRNEGESIFSYSLTRPYPFRWFTWVVAIGGAIFIVLFSFVSLAADGYNIDLQYTPNLNATLNETYWFQKAPFSWVSKTQASCQPALLTTGSSYFTSNFGYIYTIDRLWREDSVELGERVLPAVPYQNSLLRNCEVQAITINFLRSDDTRLADNYWTWASTTASATVTCAFETAYGGIKANLTTQLPEIRDYAAIRSSFLSGNVNVTDHANLWFGAQFTYSWYNQVSRAIGYTAPPDGVSTWDSGFVTLSRNPSVNDYTDLNFFYCLANFWTNTGETAWIKPPNTTADWANPVKNNPVEGNLTLGYQLPNVTTTIDTFAKSFYSLLLSDLGAVSQANALLTPAGVQWLGDQVDHHLAINTNNSEYSGWGSPSGRPVIPIPNAFDKEGPQYPINDAYQSVVDALGGPPNLNSTPSSTIYTQYLCSIPQRKGGGALFFAVLLADLVFLQAVWTLLNLGASWWLHQKYKQVNYCDGCRTSGGPIAAGTNSSEYQLLGVGPDRSSSSALQNDRGLDGEVQTRPWSALTGESGRL